MLFWPILLNFGQKKSFGIQKVEFVGQTEIIKQT